MISEKGEGINILLQNGALRCVIDLTTYWKERSTIYIIENSSDELQLIYLSKNIKELLEVKSGVFLIDSTLLTAQQLLQISEKYTTIIVMCGNMLTEDILTKVITLNLFTLNHHWILASSSKMLNFPKETQISPDTQVTVIVGKLMAFDIYDIFQPFKSNKTEYVQFGNWSATRGLLVFEDFTAGDGFQGLRKRTFRSIGLLQEPYLEVANISGTVHFSGLLIDVVRAVVEQLNASLADIKTMGQVFGLQQNGTFTGLMGRLYRREFDISINSIGMTADRQPATHYIVPLISYDMCLIYEKLPQTISPTTHWLPFPATIWLVIAALIVTSIACLATITTSHLQLSDDNTTNSTFQLISWTFLVNVLENPLRPSVRVTFATVVVAILITFQHYSAILYSNLSHKQPNYPIKTMQDLAQDSTYLPVVVDNTIYVGILKFSNRSDYRDVWKKLEKGGSSLIKTYPPSARKQMFEGKFVLITDQIIARGRLADQCGIVVFKQPEIKGPFSMLARHGFPYSRMIKKRVIRLKEYGIITRLNFKYNIGSQPDCHQEAKSLPFQINQILLPFYILVGGWLLSILTFVIENVVKIPTFERSFPTQ